MSCAETRDLLALDEDLLEPEEAQLRSAHLEACAGCRAEAAALLGACAELGAVEAPRVSAAVREQVLNAVEPKQSSLEWLTGALVVLACALGLAWVLGTPVEPGLRTDPPGPPLTDQEPPTGLDGLPHDEGGVIFYTNEGGVIFYTPAGKLGLQAGHDDPNEVQPVGK